MEGIQLLGTLKQLGALEGFNSFSLLILAIIVVLPFWRIFKRVGYPPAIALIAIIPFAGIVLLYVLAFAPWPHLKRKEGKSQEPPPIKNL